MADTLESLEIEVKHSASGAAKEVDALTEAVKGLSKALEPCITRMRNFSSAMAGVSSGSKVSAGLSETVSAANKVKPAMDSAASGVKNLSKAASKSTGPMGNFLSSLKRIAFYRFVRTIIKELTEAFKEGLENAYEYSKVMGGELAPALDRIATASQQMKNQLGAALGELIVSLEPLIVELIHLITLLAQAFTWLFATMEGRSEYLVANEVATSWKKADKAAKEYKRTILGFDVINRLNGPGDGGKGTDYSTMFERSPVSIDFKWQDISRFFAPLDDWVDGTLDALGELATVLEEVFGTEYSLDFNTNLNVDLPFMDKVKQWIDGFVGASPYTANLNVEVFDPQPQFNEVLGSIRVFLTKLLVSTVTTYTELRESVSEKMSQIVESMSTAFEKMKSRVSTILETMRANATSTYETLKNELVKKTSEMAQKVSVRYDQIRTSINTSLVNARTNIITFVTSTMTAFRQWSGNVANNARAAFVNIAQNVYLALTNAGENIAAFINTTSANIWEWANNTASNFADWARGVANSVGDALSSAWESFKSFMQATGEAISGWWSRNKTWVVPVTIGAAITVAAVALAPATGGVSLGALAFAANGGTFPNNGSLLVAGEAGPEIVANLGNSTGVMNVDQMRSAIRDGMLEAILASNRDGKTELHVYLDSREIKYGQSRLSRAMGV